MEIVITSALVVAKDTAPELPHSFSLRLKKER